MLRDVAQHEPAGSDEDDARTEAIKAIGRRRRFWDSTVGSGIVMAIVAVIWAVTEYHNAGGWPTQGFSQSSGITNVWNIWIIYPFIAWVLFILGAAWRTFGHRPISEDQIKREIERRSASQHS